MREFSIEADQVDEGEPRSGRPGPVRGPSARAYLLIVLGEFAMGQAEAAWTHTVIGALDLVGFEERAARKTLTRAAADGLIEPERVGRRTRWHITRTGHDLLLAAKNRLFASGPEGDWDGNWLMVFTGVPENHRNLRHRLRTSLSWAGFGSLGPGVWISPHPSHAAEAREILDSLGEAVHGTVLHAQLDDPDERHRLVAQAWDVSDLDVRYHAFLERFSGTAPESAGEALADLAHLIYQWRRLLLIDPGLPPSLLPPDWSGEQARRLLLDRHVEWHKMAQTWWQASESG
jgi:phenylacetic acid degradation operon negative regulatory protein